MWFGELFTELLKVQSDIASHNVGNAQDRLIAVTTRLTHEGLIIKATLEHAGGEGYESING